MKKIAYLLTMLLLLAACSTKREYAYLKDAPRNEQIPIKNPPETLVKKGDNLYIFVYSQLPESARPFNQETNTMVSNKKPMGYIVGEEGDIIFPVLGRIHAEGLTPDSLTHYIERRLEEGRYVTDAVVTLKITNFGVTVVGEVKHPREVICNNNRISILEALAQCGDITIDGIRTNVKVIRTIGDELYIDTVDLTSSSLFESPCYYLQQGDIVYVEPSPEKKKKAYRDEDWPKYLTTGISAVNLAWVLVYRIFFSRVGILRNN